MAIKFKSKHSKYALLDCFGHVPARVYLTNESWVDVGRFSYSAIKTFLMFNNAGFSGELGRIGDFCEFARESQILLGGEHNHSNIHNYVLSSSPPVQFLCWREGFDTKHQRKGPIVIGDGVISHFRTTILSGATIGDGVVIGAGSLVLGDLEEAGIYAGVPAKKIARRDVQMQALKELEHFDAIGVSKLLAGKNIAPDKFKGRSRDDRLLMMIKYRASSGEGGDYDFRILGAFVKGQNFPLKSGTPFFQYATQAANGSENSDFFWEPDPLGLKMT